MGGKRSPKFSTPATGYIQLIDWLCLSQLCCLWEFLTAESKDEATDL